LFRFIDLWTLKICVTSFLMLSRQPRASHHKTAASSYTPLITKYSAFPCNVGPYKFLECIGEGGFASVFLVSHSEYDTKFVAKVMTCEAMQMERIWRACDNEVRALINLNHPNVVRMYDHFRHGCQLFLILEYCAGGSALDSLHDRDGMDERQFIRFAKQAVDALAYCHSCNIAHRDIKPGNFLVGDRKQVKLADFGLCREFCCGDKIKEFGGSTLFEAPEIFLRRSHDPKLADVWALGVTFAVMATGGAPWEYNSLRELRGKSERGEIVFRRPISPMLEDLIRKMIVVSPSERLTMNEIKSHPLFDAPKTEVRPLLKLPLLDWGSIPRSGRSEEADAKCPLRCTFGLKRATCRSVPQRTYVAAEVPAIRIKFSEPVLEEVPFSDDMDTDLPCELEEE
jgi:serine/threonine protein kinase